MTPKELVQKIQQENSNLSGIPENRAVALVLAAFNLVADAIDGTEEGVVRVRGFGQFHIKRVEREIEGNKVTRKVVMLRRPAPVPPAVEQAKAPTKAARRR